MINLILQERMSLYKVTLSNGLLPKSPTTPHRSSPPCNTPTKIIFIISLYLTVQEVERLRIHGKSEYYSYLADSAWKYIILDIRVELDRQWIMSNITSMNEFVVIVTNDNPDSPKWLKVLIDKENVTNVLQKIPIIMDESFDRRVINSLWLPKRNICGCF